MDTPEDPHHEKDSDDKAASEAPIAASASSHDGGAANDLPAVQSPKLSSEETDEDSTADTVHEESKKRLVGALPALFSVSASDAPRGPEADASDQQQRHFRFALLAATIACAAGMGALAGSLTASGIGHQSAAVAAIPYSADARDSAGALKAQRAELSALKASLDSANRSAGAQLAKITDRLNSLEHAQADTTAKLTHIGDVVDRLEKTGTAEDVTGSIAAPGTAGMPAAQPRLTGPVLHDWAVQDVRNGRAMVESRYGGFFLVGAGSIMPGLGRVEQVKRQNGEWIVVTEKGLITQRP
jgi:hypothetical protein